MLLYGNMNPASMWFSTILKILWLVFLYGHTHMQRCAGIQNQQETHIGQLSPWDTVWPSRFGWEFSLHKKLKDKYVCKKIVFGRFFRNRYATLHSWGHALVRYIRLILNICQYYCKMDFCYWLVSSTYYVDFLKYFTSFNKSFIKSLSFIYTSKKNQFSP